jgi:adenosylcobinamide-GDP ribazoletransferase
VVLSALRGAVGFLTRLPVRHDDAAWTAFRESPWAFPLAGYLVGTLLAAPFLLVATPVPATAITVTYLAAVFAVTGINHLDGVADVADAAIVHGDDVRRREVLKDTTVGVGAVAGIVVAVLGLAFGAFGVAALPARVAVGVVVATEVGTKAATAAVACLGTATHEGLGSQFTEGTTPGQLVAVAVVAAPAALLAWPRGAPAGALLGAVAGGLVTLAYVRRLLGGVSGDVFGAVNEVGRVVGVHAGVIAWTLS